MKAVWKFPLARTVVPQLVQMPRGARVMHAAMQGSFPTLWAEVDTAGVLMERSFEVIGTGQAIYPGRTHVGSLLDGEFVWHVFEVGP